MKYIVKNRHGVYQVRIRLPKQLQNHFNRKEINKSLETKEKKLAIQKASLMLHNYHYLIVTEENTFISTERLQALVDEFTGKHLH